MTFGPVQCPRLLNIHIWADVLYDLQTMFIILLKHDKLVIRFAENSYTGVLRLIVKGLVGMIIHSLEHDKAYFDRQSI